MVPFACNVAFLKMRFAHVPYLILLILFLPSSHVFLVNQSLSYICLTTCMTMSSSSTQTFHFSSFFLSVSIFLKYAKRVVSCSQGMKISLFTAALSLLVPLLILLKRWWIISAATTPSYPIYSILRLQGKVLLLFARSMTWCFLWLLNTSHTLFLSMCESFPFCSLQRLCPWALWSCHKGWGLWIHSRWLWFS